MEEHACNADSGTQRQPRIAVVTAVSGGKDILRAPVVDTGAADFIAFSDRPLPNLRGWEVRALPQWSSDPRFGARRNAKLPKVLPHFLLPDYDFFVWIDGNIELTASPEALCDRFAVIPNADIAVFPHRTRRCIFAESKAVLRRSLDHPELVKSQMRAYRLDGIRPDAGLFELGFIIQRNNETARALGLRWFEQICRYSSRDQLSFPVALAASGARLEPITPGHCLDNPYMRLRPHERPDAVLPLLDRLARSSRRIASRLRRRVRQMVNGEAR